jgi:oleate hydratase
MVYLIGGGIASLSAAAFLIRDANISGDNILILEQLDRLGGSLDGSGSPETGYVLRGGRMMESKYLCTYDLFSSIPTLDGSKTVTQEIFDWNDVLRTASKSRLVRDGKAIDAPEFGLEESHILSLERVAAEPEVLLDGSSIADQFPESFFQTNFWLMWSTTFAFQPWHSAVEFKRYLLRFSHMVSGFNQLRGIMRTVYNQYDSMVRPLEKWLLEGGVRFELDTVVTNLGFREDCGLTSVDRILYSRCGFPGQFEIAASDSVIVTLGSMTENSSLGSMESAPVLGNKMVGGAWTLWENIAAGRPEFGKPSVFADHIDESKWISFTTTLHDRSLFEFIHNLTGNVPGQGGLITFADSSWRMSVVLPYQPHFIGQPEEVEVMWGYGLFVDEPGDFVKKPMSACTGREIMTEVLGHLRAQELSQQILSDCICIPCMMPFITSQFLRREPGDRPPVIPKRTMNLAFTGQFCELAHDVVFTVEYSIRSAQTAVDEMFAVNRKPPAVYQGQYNAHILYEAFRALHDMKV